MRRGLGVCSLLLGLVLLVPVMSFAQLPNCAALSPLTYAQVRAALQNVVGQNNGGFGLPMWATLLNRRGEVCMVVQSGAHGTAIPTRMERFWTQ